MIHCRSVIALFKLGGFRRPRQRPQHVRAPALHQLQHRCQQPRQLHRGAWRPCSPKRCALPPHAAAS